MVDRKEHITKDETEFVDLKYLLLCIKTARSAFEFIQEEIQFDDHDEWSDPTYTRLVMQCVGACGDLLEKAERLREIIFQNPVSERDPNAPDIEDDPEFQKFLEEIQQGRVDQKRRRAIFEY